MPFCNLFMERPSYWTMQKYHTVETASIKQQLKSSQQLLTKYIAGFLINSCCESHSVATAMASASL